MHYLYLFHYVQIVTLKIKTKSIPIGVADRIRRNCSDNVVNDVTYRERLIEYKAYLIAVCI